MSAYLSLLVGIFVLTAPYMWVVVKIMVPIWVPVIARHLLFRVPKGDHNFDSYPFE